MTSALLDSTQLARRILLGLAVGFIALVVALVVVNPWGAFPGHRFAQPKPNYRMEKLRLLDAYLVSHHPDAIIMGGSRAAKVDPDDLRQFTGLEFFSMTVLGADAEDYLATWRLFLARHSAPKVVVVGLDADAFGEFDMSEFKRDLDYIAAYEGTTPTPSRRLRHELTLLRATLTASYIADAGQSLWSIVRPPNVRFVFRADGVLEYPYWDRQIAAGTYKKDRCPDAFAKAFKPLDTARLRPLERMLQEAKDKGTRVVLWISPIHPNYLHSLAGNPRKQHLEDVFGETIAHLGSTYGAATVDFTRLESSGADPGDWYDCVHFGHVNARWIARTLADTLALGNAPH
jgi:hypothetical protein